MFSTKITPEEITLQSEGSEVKIWPAHGAILNEWNVKSGDGTVSVIDGYDSHEEFEKQAEKKGFRSCKLSPYVCRLYMRTYTHEGEEYKNIGKFIENGSALHGLLYDEKFEVKGDDSSQQSASVTLGYSYDGSDEGYPFPYDMEVVYELLSGNELRLTTRVTNTGNNTIPIADGWHPYFKLGDTVDDCKFRVASGTQVEFNQKLIPTGNLIEDVRFKEDASLDGVQLDNCFVVEEGQANNWVCQLRDEKTGIALDMYAEENYPYLQTYTPPHRKSIALENLSGTPDCFNNGIGLRQLDAGETIQFAAKYKITAP